MSEPKGALLLGTEIYGCELDDANFKDVDLEGAFFDYHSLKTANLENAKSDEYETNSNDLEHCFK